MTLTSWNLPSIKSLVLHKYTNSSLGVLLLGYSYHYSQSSNHGPGTRIQSMCQAHCLASLLCSSTYCSPRTNHVKGVCDSVQRGLGQNSAHIFPHTVNSPGLQTNLVPDSNQSITPVYSTPTIEHITLKWNLCSEIQFLGSWVPFSGSTVSVYKPPQHMKTGRPHCWKVSGQTAGLQIGMGDKIHISPLTMGLWK